ncbi:MAG TPA: 2-succinyl-5-enolpyruvyl-6-hydroxy-3-cyclohexene-1-carboxylic-acid synthase [Baekduia sp.]|nr:2-succinyl-5-enolpyruvyl-6-hydroxy-3-cyclohexene-1-carboxylic-acid synthase [Baekduia sp.]
MSETRDTYILLRAFVDELARCGVAGACTSPGSRSTPLVLTLARDGRIPVTSHVDERAAGFFALGLVKATGRPAVLACTSGTAAANYAPAVIEAHEARLPLIVLTADRPPELRDVGAGQVIDQIKLYGSAAKWFVEVGSHGATPDRLRWMRQLACRAMWTALDDRPGPVHLNVPLREPLVLDEPLPAEEPGGGGRPGGAPWTARTTAPQDPAPLVDWLRERRRGVIVAGRDESGGPMDGVAALADAMGWPLLADPLSDARRGGAAIAHYDALLRDERWAASAAAGAESVLRVGDLPTSKPLRQWLRGLDVPQAGLLSGGAWHDPDATLERVFDLRPAALAAIDEPWPVDDAWLGTWRAADASAARALAATLGDDLSEPAVAREVATAVPAGARVVVAASMPIRDVETFWPVDAPASAISNRGANGIDGTISTAYGVAAASGAPTYLHIGDVALAHDVGGLLAGKRLGLPLTIVVVDNAGGGIFEFLPIATQRDAFEEHVLTPTGLDVEAVAALYGAAYRPVDDVAALRAVLRVPPHGTTLVHVRTDRAANVALHRACWDAVRSALDT